jgi:hypothetical protein
MVIPQILSIANGNPDEFESTIKFNFEINERAMTEETISLVEKAIEGHGADLKKYKWFSTLEANLIIFKMMYKSFNERDAQTIHDEGAPRLEEIRRDFEEKGGLSDFKN